jgi:hypothetical protein
MVKKGNEIKKPDLGVKKAIFKIGTTPDVKFIEGD